MSTVLITGANRGIGLQLAQQYAAAGHTVHGCCRDPQAATDLSATDGVTVHQLVPTDVDSIAAVAGAIKEAIDTLIINHGTPGPAPDAQTALNMDWDGWMETFAVNTVAPLKVLQGLLEHLKRSDNGKAITITSQMGALDLNWPTMYAYCSSKAAVNKIMRMISVELAQTNVAVGLIHPGWVQTDMGGAQADISPQDSASGIIEVIDGITLENTGCFMKWNGEPHNW